MHMQTTFPAIAVGAAMLLLPISAVAATTQHAEPAATAQRASDTAVNWQVPLHAGRTVARATGSSQYQTQPGQRELQIEIERLRTLAGRSLLVRVNGAGIGTMKVSQTGIAQLTRNTELGQKVPMIGHGSTVTVQTTAGLLIASGRY